MAKALAGRAVPADQQDKCESDDVAPANGTRDRSALRNLQVDRVLAGKDGGQSWQHTSCHQPRPSIDYFQQTTAKDLLENKIAIW